MITSKKLQTTLLLTSIVLLTVCLANAQKLPNIQTTSVRAPSSIKTDGKATEWNNQLQAHNKSTGIYYTIANDDKNLYLTIKATDNEVIKRIVNNTFSFAINKLGDGKKTLSITLPIFAGSDKRDLSRALNPREDISADSLMFVGNLTMEKVKEFVVKGFEGINDENISVYNDYGIKAKALFDNTKALTYELVIPRKYINTASNKLNYTISVYGLGAEKGSVITDMGGGAIMIQNEAAQTLTVMKNPGEAMSLMATTDFTGNYELAK